MDCPGCGFENPKDMRFCGGCGDALVRPCSGCGFACPPEFAFCGKCGAPLGDEPVSAALPPARAPRDYTPKHLADRILQSKSALEGERKQVTVLFADLKSSMELTEQVDPEEWHRILERFFEILTEGVHRFEGSVNQYTGDGIMAIFGAPIAHEDHAQRACYAALQLRDALRTWSDELRVERGIALSVRMGINSGEVVVGKIGDDLRMDYTAQGQTVGLAQRMEQLAEARTICISDRTERLVGDWFELRDLGSPPIKGVGQPVRVYELEGVGSARTRLDTSQARGFSKFVGREEESKALEAALERARAGQGGVVGIVADAGTGKSRLCHEFMERSRAQGVLVRHVYGVAHGKRIPLLPVLDLMRQVFGIGARDSDREARQKIAGAVVLVDESMAEEIPLLFDFLGVPDPQRPAPSLGPEARQRRVVELVRRFSLARSRQEAAVIVFEDLHWIDPASEAFVEAMVAATEGVRSLVVVNFRPEYSADWMRRSFYQQVALRPLDAAAIEEMLEEWLGGDDSLRGLAARIGERTGGTPFFVEEVVQSLIESGALEGARGAYRLTHPVDQIEVPATVQALLAARIDRLSEREKRVLQTSAVIGKEFSRSLLARVADLPDPELDTALYALVQAEFIYEQALYPEVEHAFKHPLTQEVALGSQLRERRAQTHRAVATALEGLHADDLDEKAGLLAHHWEEAGEPVVSARWHLRTARWTGGRDTSATVTHMLVARDLLDGAPETDESMRLGVEVRAQLMPYTARSQRVAEQYDALFEQAEAISLRLGDEHTRARLIQSRVYSEVQVGGRPEHDEAIDEAMQIADRLGDFDLRVGLRTSRAIWSFVGARRSVVEGVRFCDDAIELVGDRKRAGFALTGANAIVMLWFVRGSLLSLAGRREDAVRSHERGIELARELDDLLMLPPGYAFPVHPFGCDDLVDPASAMAYAERCAEVAERAGTTAGHVFSNWVLGVAHRRNGRTEQAVSHLERMLAAIEEAGAMTALVGVGHTELAQTLLEVDPERARLAMDRALAVRERSWDGPRFDVVDARVRLACGDREAAAAAIEHGRAVIRTIEAPSWVPELDRLAAELDG